MKIETEHYNSLDLQFLENDYVQKNSYSEYNVTSGNFNKEKLY